MSTDVKFHDFVHPTCLLEELLEFRRLGMFCDVTLVVNEEKISAHRVILAAASPYFRAMFSTGMKETNEEEVSMDVDYIGLRDIVNYIYTSEIEICEQNVYSVMELCDMLQIPALRPACSHYLMSTLKPSNCLSVYVRAELGGYHDLAHVAYRTAVQNFSSLVKEEEFLHLPADTLASFLESRFLNVTGEGQVLQCIIQWMRYDPARSLYIENLTSKVDLQSVPVEDLLAAREELQDLENTKLSELISSTIVTLNHNVENVETALSVQEKRFSRARYALKLECGWMTYNPALSMYLENLISKVVQSVPAKDLLAAGEELQVLENTKLSELITNTIVTLIQNIENVEIASSVQEKMFSQRRYASELASIWMKCNLDLSLYLENLISNVDLQSVPLKDLLAAREELQVLENTKLSELICSTIVRMRQHVENVETASSVQEKMLSKARYASEQEVLLAFGGELEDWAQNTVECFTLGYDDWKCVVPWAVPTREHEEETRVLPTMHQHRYDFAVAARDYEVFVIGGWGHDDEEFLILDSVEYYSIKTNTWTEVQGFPFAVSGAKAAFVNCNLMVVGGVRDDRSTCNNAWVYEEHHNAWRQVASMKQHRAYHGVVTVADCLYAVGGLGGKNVRDDHELSCMERYSPQLDRWHTLSPMVERRARFGCAALDQFIYVLGGAVCKEWSQTVERYNTLTNSWSYVCSMYYPCINFATTVSNNCIYILGGGGDERDVCRQEVHKYDVYTNTWDYYYEHSMHFMRCKLGSATLFVPCFSNS